MKFKNLLIGVGIAGVVGAVLVAGYSSQTEADLEATQPVEEPVAIETVADKAALEEMLAEVAAPQAPVEIKLNEEALADFLEADLTTTDSGLQYVIEEKGSGVVPEVGDVVQLHYKGMLADGTVFDSSYELDKPVAFPYGHGLVIPGWEEGVSLLNVGSKAKFIIPPELAYAEYGALGIIPPNATLYFEVELLDILPGSPEAPAEVAETSFITTESGLKYYDLAVGDGGTPEPGQLAIVHYTGWLEDGTKFDSSLDWGRPFVFLVGQQMVIPGWDEAVSTMKVGDKRQLIVPPELAYGEEGIGGVIPPDATLTFEVELIDIQQS